MRRSVKCAPQRRGERERKRGKEKEKVKLIPPFAIAALKAALATDQFNYGFVRITETIDQTEAIKFCFIKSQPEATSFKSKGKLGLLGGAVSNVFHPYHGDVFIDEVGDLKIEEVILATKKVSIYVLRVDHKSSSSNTNLYSAEGGIDSVIIPRLSLNS